MCCVWHPALACRLASPGLARLDGETTLAGHHLPTPFHPLQILPSSGIRPDDHFGLLSRLLSNDPTTTCYDISVPWFSFVFPVRRVSFRRQTDCAFRHTTVVVVSSIDDGERSFVAASFRNLLQYPALDGSTPSDLRVSHHPPSTTLPPTTLNPLSALRMGDTTAPRQYVPLTCHGHSRPVPHLSFSPLEKEDVYYMISACKGLRRIHPPRLYSH